VQALMTTKAFKGLAHFAAEHAPQGAVHLLTRSALKNDKNLFRLLSNIETAAARGGTACSGRRRGRRRRFSLRYRPTSRPVFGP
jgi:hypothetical protein